MKSFKLDHIALTVIDIEITEKFYSNILGLTKIYRPKFDTPGLWYSLGECSLHLILSTDNKKAVNKTTQPHFAIAMTDSDYLKQLFFYDPSFNMIEINTDI